MHLLTTTLISFEQNKVEYLTQIAIYTQTPVCTDSNCEHARFLKHSLIQVSIERIEYLYSIFPNIWQFALLCQGQNKESLIHMEEDASTNFKLRYCKFCLSV